MNYLPHRMRIQRMAGVKDTFGQVPRIWSTVAVVFARLTPLTGRELELAQAKHALATYAVRMRYRTDIHEAMRLVMTGRVFDILNINDENEAHQWLDLTCGAGVNDGA